MNTKFVDLSIVIPTLGTCPHLRGLLERLQRQQVASTTGATLKMEVLVVANLPKQELRSLVNSMNRSSQVNFEYLETGKLGVNLARNKGLERAKGEIILFLDDDAILEDLEGADEKFLERHVHKHLENPNAAAIGGPYRLVGRHSIWDEAYHIVATQWLQRHILNGHLTTQLLGGNLSVKRHVFEKGFRFDDVIPYGGAETGFCQRLIQSRQTLLFFSELGIGHAPTLTKGAFCKKAFLQGAGARWREQNLNPVTNAHINEMRRARIPDSIAKQVRLYGECFNFGWSANPFSGELVRNSRVQFRPLHFHFFMLSRWVLKNLPLAIRNQVRAYYAATRSIWYSAKY